MELGARFDEPTDTREAAMCATYRALCTHGYADLTIQRISDAFPKSKSLLYHHYDSKDDLLADFCSFMLEHFEAAMPAAEDDSADEQLTALLEFVLPADPDADRRRFIRAMIELRAQAAADSEYRSHFTRSSGLLQERFVDLIERGHEEGSFRAVDAERVASLLVATVEGAMLQQATTSKTHAARSVSAARAELSAYIATRLRVDGPTK